MSSAPAAAWGETMSSSEDASWSSSMATANGTSLGNGALGVRSTAAAGDGAGNMFDVMVLQPAGITVTALHGHLDDGGR